MVNIKKNNLVSVIIPLYNAETYIESCVNSILKQSYREIEILIIDNNSSDDSYNLVLRKFGDFPNVKILKCTRIGAAFARNLGLENATGEFIQFLDADDYLSSNKIEIQLSQIRKNYKTIVFCETRIFGDSSNTNHELLDSYIYKNYANPIDLVKILLGINGRKYMIQPNAYLMHKDLLVDIIWNEDFVPCSDDDGEFFLRVLLNADNVVFTQGTNFYRKSVLNNTLSLNKDYQKVLNLIEMTCLKYSNLKNKIEESELMFLLNLNLSEIMYTYGPGMNIVEQKIINIFNRENLGDFNFNNHPKFNLCYKIFGLRITFFLKKYIFSFFT